MQKTLANCSRSVLLICAGLTLPFFTACVGETADATSEEGSKKTSAEDGDRAAGSQSTAKDSGSATDDDTTSSSDDDTTSGSDEDTASDTDDDTTSGSDDDTASDTDDDTTSGTASSVDPKKLEGFGSSTTGGEGGQVVTATTGTEIHEAICGRPADDTPLVIRVEGTIAVENTTKVSGNCETRDDAIEFKRVSNLSLIGVGTAGVLDQIGIHLRETENIIIQNLHIKNVKKSGTPTSNGGDAISMESGVDRVWVDHNTLEASGGESSGYDSLIDMKAGVTNVTVSYNLLRNSSRGGLVGSNDADDANTDITFHHNWYLNIEQRTPLLRHGRVHSYNNYWSNENLGDMIHGINSRMFAQVLVEGNYFHNTNNILIASDDSSEPGCWQTGENTITPEIYYSRTVGDGALVVPAVIDGQLQSTCEVTVPYDYDLQPSSEVPATVELHAGVGNL